MKRIRRRKKEQFNVRVTAEQLEALRREAWERNKSISTLVRETLLDNKLLSLDGER